jgi:hypothetical protein
MSRVNLCKVWWTVMFTAVTVFFGVLVVLWWSAATYLASQFSPTVLYLYQLQTAGVMTPLSMHTVCELCACLLGPCWPRIFAPTSSLVISFPLLMIINSEHLTLTATWLFLLWLCVYMCLQVSRE